MLHFIITKVFAKQFNLAIIIMKGEYTDILNEMVKNYNMIQHIDGRKLLSYLQSCDVINFQDKEELYQLGPTECSQKLIKVVLKLKKDEDMMHFLNSLRYAKYSDASSWLTAKLRNTSLTNGHQHVLVFDKKKNAVQFLWEVRDPTVNFIGRNVQLKELHNKMLQSGKKVGADAKKIVITGVCGIGKTQLALRYVQLYSQQYDNNIIWINAESDVTLRNSFINLAEDLNIAIKNANGVEKETSKILKGVYTYFSMAKCLFVFDNADKSLKDDFYPNCQFKIYTLITSRHQMWEPNNVFHLDNFSSEEASHFIRISLKISLDFDENQVANLAEKLHFFPLALKQATAYINETSEIKNTYSIDDYIKEYNENKENLLYYMFDSDFGNEYFLTTFTTWKIIIDKLDGNANDNYWVQKFMKIFSLLTAKTAGNMAINILDYISYFAHEQIDMQIFVQQKNDNKIFGSVRLLKEYSLVTEENGLLNVHPLVQEVTRLNIKQKGTEKETFTTVCRLVVSYFEQLKRSNDYCKQKILLPHSEKLLQEMKSWLIKNPAHRKHIEQESITNLLIQMSNAYSNIGQERQTKSLLKQLLSIKIEQHGQDHSEVAIVLASLGNAYGALGRPEKQKTLLEIALVIQEQYYGSDHYEVAGILVNLGITYGVLGEPERQKSSLEKALAIQERHYGPACYAVAQTLANLSNAYGVLKQPERQKTLLEKTLVIQEKQYGSYHYEVAQTLVNLGITYGILGKPERQKILLEKALVIQEKHYGSDHYKVAQTLVPLGITYGVLGEPERQKILLEKALVIQEKLYGSDHYKVAQTLVPLGITYGVLGEPERQKILLEKALAIQEKHYGPDHYEVALTLVNLGRAYGAVGQPEKEITLLKKALITLIYNSITSWKTLGDSLFYADIKSVFSIFLAHLKFEI